MAARPLPLRCRWAPPALLLLPLLLQGCVSRSETTLVASIEITREEDALQGVGWELLATTFEDPGRALAPPLDSERDRLERHWLMGSWGSDPRGAWGSFHADRRGWGVVGFRAQAPSYCLFLINPWFWYDLLSGSRRLEAFLSSPRPAGIWIDVVPVYGGRSYVSERQRFVVLRGASGPEVHRVEDSGGAAPSTVMVGRAERLPQGPDPCCTDWWIPLVLRGTPFPRGEPAPRQGRREGRTGARRGPRWRRSAPRRTEGRVRSFLTRRGWRWCGRRDSNPQPRA